MLNKRDALRLLGSAAAIAAVSAAAGAAHFHGFDSELVSTYRKWLIANAAYDHQCSEWTRLSAIAEERCPWPERLTCLRDGERVRVTEPLLQEITDRRRQLWPELNWSGQSEPYIAVIADLRGHHALFEAIYAETGAAEAERLSCQASKARAALEKQIHDIEAEGLAGVVVKLALFLDIQAEDEDDFCIELVKSCLKTLNGIVGLPLP